MLPDGGAVTGAILVDQIKPVDAKARDLKTSDQFVDSDLMNDVRARLATLTG